MFFKIVPRGASLRAEPDVVYLEIDHWNDYSYVTQFSMHYQFPGNELLRIGDLKIGFKGQTTADATYAVLPDQFIKLNDEFFSIGDGVEFYKNIASLSNGVGFEILNALRDVVVNRDIIYQIEGEQVFSVSLLRGVSLSVVMGQWHRTLVGAAEPTNFDFRFYSDPSDTRGEVELDFHVLVNSVPSTNVHAIIGRNGVGKTSILNGMIEAVIERKYGLGFVDLSLGADVLVDSNYFSSIVSVSFSAFDPFLPPENQADPAKGTCYFYVGLKDAKNPDSHRTPSELRTECVESLASCFRNNVKARRWLKAIDKLGSDENFAAMRLDQLMSEFSLVKQDKSLGQADSTKFLKEYGDRVDKFLTKMSSGHAVVLLTVTRLVDTVQEKALVLLDEPESHLHPPLLSAFVRALTDLMHDQNAVALIATHSPVILQEIPRSCVSKIYRVGLDVAVERPKIETFAENVGRLTNEVFSLEVGQSGFHSLLRKSVDQGGDFPSILAEYDGQLGLEGRAILAALIAERDLSRA